MSQYVIERLLQRMRAAQRRLARLEATDRPYMSLRIAATHVGLPGLRAFWSLASFDGAGNAVDQSGYGRHLTRNGDPDGSGSRVPSSFT